MDLLGKGNINLKFVTLASYGQKVKGGAQNLTIKKLLYSHTYVRKIEFIIIKTRKPSIKIFYLMSPE